jgi:hypothetical protein
MPDGASLSTPPRSRAGILDQLAALWRRIDTGTATAGEAHLLVVGLRVVASIARLRAMRAAVEYVRTTRRIAAAERARQGGAP